MITRDINGQVLPDSYRATVKSESRSFLAALYLNGTELNCAVKRLEFSKGTCGSTTDFTVGNLISSTITGELLELTDNIKGEEIEARIGLEVEGSYIWLTMGYYTITEAKKTIYSTTITGHGRIVSKTGRPFTEPLTTKTLSRIAQEIGVEMGCTVSFGSGINTSRVITESMANLTTYQALQVLASVVGGYAVDTNDGNVKIERFRKVANIVADSGMMLTLPDIEERQFEITGVQCIIKEASTDAEGEIPAEGYAQGSPINLLMNNKYMTQAIFTETATALIGYSYRPASINLSLGDPRIEGVDVMQITDADEEIYKVPCHVLTHIYDGGFRTTIEAVRATNEENSIGSITPFQKLLEGVNSGLIGVRSDIRKVRLIADNTAQYFWMVETGSDTGAHITEIPREDFEADPQNGGGNLLARSNGIAVRDGLTELAQFSASSVVVGQQTQSHMEMSAKRLSAFASDGTTVYFRVGDMKGEETTHYYVGDGSTTEFSVYAPSTTPTVYVNGTRTTAFTWTAQNVIFTTAPAEGDSIQITYNYGGVTPYMIIGKPMGNYKPGRYSVSEGCETYATGGESHAEGQHTYASGNQSHAEGYETSATNFQSHAEGYQTYATGKRAHAEGYQCSAAGHNSHAGGITSRADGVQSFAHGYSCYAEGHNSVALGLASRAEGQNQTVIGHGNAADSTSLFLIGNGAVSGGQTTSPSNAFEVDQAGNVNISGTLTQGSDKRLKEHIEYLDDDAVEFVRKLKPAHYTKDDKSHVGFYAQDVEEADEWDCMTGEMNGYKTLSYTELIAPLVKYCQKLEERIAELEAKL